MSVPALVVSIVCLALGVSLSDYSIINCLCFVLDLTFASSGKSVFGVIYTCDFVSGDTLLDLVALLFV